MGSRNQKWQLAFTFHSINLPRAGDGGQPARDQQDVTREAESQFYQSEKHFSYYRTFQVSRKMCSNRFCHFIIVNEEKTNSKFSMKINLRNSVELDQTGWRRECN